MNYKIEIADITDPGIDLAIRKLVMEAYYTTVDLPEKFLAANIISKASKESFILVAKENNEITGCNAFIANDFIFNGEPCIGYQSCWSVVHPKHQGKQIFSSLINEAKRILKEQGAGFLYGIANDKSNPIITKKLGFTETASLVLRIPNIPFVRNFYFTRRLLQKDNNGCLINEMQVMERKAAQFPDEVKIVKCGDSWLWGKLIEKKKYGFKLPVFYVGGVHLAVEKDMPHLVSAVFKLKRVLFVQFFSCKTNRFNVLLRGWKKPNMNGFIFFNLNSPSFEHFDLMIGTIDVF